MWLERFLVFLLLCVSGNPLLLDAGSNIFIFFWVFVFLVCVIKKYPIIDKSFLNWLFLFIILFILQYLFLQTVSIPADIGFILKLYGGYLIVKILNTNFRIRYFEVICWLSCISIVLWLITNITYLPGIEVDRYRSLVIYSYIKDIPTRNCGMFWEPGAFQGYILIIPFLFIDSIQELWQKKKKECIVLLVALLTTQSTTGFLVLAFIIAVLWLNSDASIHKKLFLGGLLSLIAVQVFVSLDFLGEKITSQYEDALTLRNGQVSLSRFGSIVIDWQNILRHPFIGNGFLMESRYSGLGNLMNGAGNGFTGAINIFGIPVIMTYLISLFRNQKVSSVILKIGAVGMIVLLLQGEYFLNYPLFWCLIFVNISYDDDTLTDNEGFTDDVESCNTDDVNYN